MKPFSEPDIIKSGFKPVGQKKDFKIFKSPKGVILHYNDGNTEGFIKNNSPVNESFMNEGISRSIIELLVIIALGTTYFTTDITIVNGVSMQPTYKSGKVIVRSRSVRNIEKMLASKNAIIKFTSPNKETCIKRIMGVPGDVVKMEGPRVYINDELVDNKNNANMLAKQKRYKDQNKKWDNNEWIIQKLKPNEFFVMGDNRSASEDSREYGPINQTNIISILQK